MVIGRKGRSRPDSAVATEAADTVQTLAVLLHAGAAPRAAWQHLAEIGDRAAVSIVGRTDRGAPLVAAIEEEGGAWRDVAAAWEIAGVVGAPLADVLRSISGAMRDAATAADDVRIALAEPAGTARMLLWMPFAGLLLGFAFGFDTIGVIVGTPTGAACVVLGLLLVLAARLWTSRLLSRARPEPGTPGLRSELVAVALSGGASVDRAVRLVAEVGPRGGDDERLATVLDLSRSAGVPAVELLRAAAAHERHEARVSGRLRAAALSTRLLVPLGVCTLPAFLLLGVAPLLLSVLSSTPLPI